MCTCLLAKFCVLLWSMPPRYVYWTILIDGAATAFRAKDREELLPTFTQLSRTNKDVTLRFFARGKLWDSPEQAQWAGEQPRGPREPRTREWRPGGDHKDPRARFDKKPGDDRDVRSRRERRAEAFGPPVDEPADETPDLTETSNEGGRQIGRAHV